MDAILEPIPTIRRKITHADVQEMARLMAKRITETGAALIIGIKPETWFHFKAKPKNQAKFEQILMHVREAQLEGHLDNIERFQIKDWRASEALLRLKSPERFGQRTEHTGEVKHMHQLSDDSKRKIEAMLKASLQQPVIDCQVVDTKQIASE